MDDKTYKFTMENDKLGVYEEVVITDHEYHRAWRDALCVFMNRLLEGDDEDWKVTCDMTYVPDDEIDIINT